MGTNTAGSFAFTAYAPGPLVDSTLRLYSGEFTGDGLEDLLLHRTAESRFQVYPRYLDGWGPPSASDPAPNLAATAQVLTGDFDGDGLDEVIVYDAVGGGMAVGLNLGSEFVFWLGLGTLGPGVNWRFTVGRFSGEPKDELAGHRPSDGALFVMSLGPGLQLVSSQWGT